MKLLIMQFSPTSSSVDSENLYVESITRQGICFEDVTKLLHSRWHRLVCPHFTIPEDFKICRGNGGNAEIMAISEIYEYFFSAYVE
jgi:anthranilate/para-aminobenzoate synthase component II